MIEYGCLRNIESLKSFLASLTYKRGWTFEINRSSLTITIETPDSTGRYPEVVVRRNEDLFYNSFHNENIFEPRPFMVVHAFPIPMDDLIGFCAERFVFDNIVKVETHEAMEFFKVWGVPVYFPDHEPGHDPYLIERKPIAAVPKEE